MSCLITTSVDRDYYGSVHIYVQYCGQYLACLTYCAALNIFKLHILKSVIIKCNKNNICIFYDFNYDMYNIFNCLVLIFLFNLYFIEYLVWQIIVYYIDYFFQRHYINLRGSFEWIVYSVLSVCNLPHVVDNIFTYVIIKLFILIVYDGKTL